MPQSTNHQSRQRDSKTVAAVIVDDQAESDRVKSIGGYGLRAHQLVL